MDESLVEDLVERTSQIQTRDAEGSLRYFDSVREAFDYAKKFTKVWKVSWFRSLPNGSKENLRFVRRSEHNRTPVWEFESADDLIEELKEEGKVL